MNDLIAKNEIVVYQPDEVTRLDVRLENESVWLSQEQMIELFKRDRSVISRHINNAFKEGEVGVANCLHILQTNQKGRPEVAYNLDVVISVGYRVKSPQGVLFRRWATSVLRERLLSAGTVERRMIIDDVVWMVGASLKDAGKKKFAVIKTQLNPAGILPMLKS